MNQKLQISKQHRRWVEGGKEEETTQRQQRGGPSAMHSEVSRPGVKGEDEKEIQKK